MGTISEDGLAYSKRCSSFNSETNPDVSDLHCLSSRFQREYLENPRLSPVPESSPKKKAYNYDNFAPMVDKGVDNSWPKANKKFAATKGVYTMSETPAGLSNPVFSGIMALVMGIVTMVRLTRNMPRKISEAAVYGSPVYYNDMVVTGHHHKQLPLAAAPPHGLDYMAVMKRMAELEERVTVLGAKPASMPAEKEELLNSAMDRVTALELELSATKKALEESLARQGELMAYLEKKQKKKKKKFFGLV